MSALASFVTRDLHVSASNSACVRHVLSKLSRTARRDHTRRHERHALIREALMAHWEHQALVSAWRL